MKRQGEEIFGNSEGWRTLPERIPTREEMAEALEIRHTKEVQMKIREARVAICGLGGLGSHIAISLARCGIGKLHLIDFDCVDLTNLNRQQYGVKHLGRPKTEALKEELLDICPYLDIETDFTELTEENIPKLLKDDFYICEAFDTPEAKAMLTEQVLLCFPDKYLVGASGMAGWGDSNRICTRKIFPHYYLCGDGDSDAEVCGGLTAPRVMLCAAHQANKIMELIIKGE